MSKHTPGPWQAQESWDEKETKEIVSTGDPWFFVAEVYANSDGAGEVDNDTARANARLIAAAPALLEVLLDVQRYFDALDEMQPTRGRGTEGKRIREAVQDAIAKAKGPA